MNGADVNERLVRLALCCVIVAIVLGTGFAFAAPHPPNSEPFDVTLVNDTSATVRLQLCQYADCTSHPGVKVLTPGDALSVRQVTDSNLRPWFVTRADGTEVGCLPLRFQTLPPPSRRHVQVSQSVPCRADYGGHAVTGPDWPPLA